MNDTTIIQIPVKTALKTEATELAHSLGFSSLQELLRVTMSQMLVKQLPAPRHYNYPVIKLSKKNDRRYTKMEDDYAKGKGNFVSFKSVDEAINYLCGNKIQSGVHKKLPKKNSVKKSR